jgi:two-component system sensor histidine kinase KdpD
LPPGKDRDTLDAEMNAGIPMDKPPDRNDAFLAAVGDGSAAESLVREAAAAARQAGASLVALHVEKPGGRAAPAADRLPGLAALARGLGAEFVTVTAANVGRGIAEFAAENRISTVIVGKTRRGPLRSLLSPVRDLINGPHPFRVLLVPNPAAARRGGGRHYLPSVSRRFPLLEYVLVLAATGLVTALNLLLAPAVGYRSIALFYLLFISFGALFLRVVPTVLAAALSALLWNYLFIPPLHTFSIARFEDVFMYVVYVVIAVLIGGLTSRLRAREQVMERAEKKISALYDLSRELGRALDRDGIARAAVKYLDRYFRGRTALFLPEPPVGSARAPAEGPPLVRHEASTLDLSDEEALAARRAFETGASATAGGRAAAVRFAPLGPATGPAGVVAVGSPGGREPDLESETFLRGAASLVALALERDAYLRRSEAARLSEESERLYRTLFNLISHELRTPLTTIKGAASSLADEAVDGRPETRRALYAEIKKASDRLNLLVANLLSMSRIESGFLKPDARPHDLRELVTAALDSLEEPGAGRVSLDIPDDLPACAVDFEFMKQVFVNLLQNAFLYAGPSARVTVAARADGGGVAITVADDGPGWAPETERHLFEKFKRGAGNPAGGLGLGLSICRGIVEAHGGTIAASRGGRGGAEIRIRLPACPPPLRPAGRES